MLVDKPRIRRVGLQPAQDLRAFRVRLALQHEGRLRHRVERPATRDGMGQNQRLGHVLGLVLLGRVVRAAMVPMVRRLAQL